MTSTISLRFNGDRRKPDRRGFIAGVTPPVDGRPGITAGQSVEITDTLLSLMNRPTGEQARAEFAEFIAGVYNANLGYEKWSVEHVESVDEPEGVIAGESTEEHAEDAVSVEEEETRE